MASAMEPMSTEDKAELEKFFEEHTTEEIIAALTSPEHLLVGSAEVIPNAIVTGVFCLRHHAFLARATMDTEGRLKDSLMGEHVLGLLRHWEEKHQWR